MTRTSMRRHACNAMVAALMAASLGTAGIAHAQPDWPTRPVRLVVPFAAGGGIDIAARLVAEKLRERWGQPVLVENRPGANTLLALQAVLGAPKDGYTLLVTNPVSFFLPDVNPSVRVRPLEEFIPIAQLTSEQLVLLAISDGSADSLERIVERARQSPKTVAFGSYGYGTPAHLLLLQLNRIHGVDITHVPYKGTAPMMQGFLAGEIRLGLSNYATARPFIEDRRLKMLAVTGPARYPFIRDVPTLAQLGISGFEMTQWAGLFAPAGTPVDLQQRLARDVSEVLRTESLVRSLNDLLLLPGASTLEEFGRVVRRDAANLGAMSRAASIRMGD